MELKQNHKYNGKTVNELFKSSTKQYDIDKLTWEWMNLKPVLPDHVWHVSKGDHGRQTMLQYSAECADISIDGCGSFRGTQRLESDYNIFNSFYESTIFETIINDLNVVRSRFMVMSEHRTYSIHQDKSPRYHVALETNPDAYFLFPSTDGSKTANLYHVPADGHVYWVDTTMSHTFVNAGPDRTHLVMVDAG